MPKILVCGAGGFIGGHLIADLRRQGHTDLRAVDKKPFAEWYQRFDEVENFHLNLELLPDCEQAVQGARNVADLVKQGVDATGRTTRIAQDLQSSVDALTAVTSRFKVSDRS